MHEYNGVMHYIYCDYAKLGCWGPIFLFNYAHMFNEIVLNEWYEIGVYFGCDCCCCVRETILESACLAQASQARLGEICRDS